MTYQEIRDHKFKLLFAYYLGQNNIDELFDVYFENVPYEDEEDNNAYVKSNVHQSVHKIVISEGSDNKNVSDAPILTIGYEENVVDIKNKVRDIISKTDEIDKLISDSLEKWDINRLAKTELVIIRLAIYEMYFDNSIDLKVAVNEAVELTKVYGDEKAIKFVNGVLSTIYKKNKKD